MKLRRSVLAVPVAVAAIGTSFAPPASGAAVVEQINDHGVVVFEDTFVPCAGPADSVTLDINYMYHFSENNNGAHEREVFTGTFEATLTGGGTSAGRLTFTDVADNIRGDGQYIVETDGWSGQILSGVGAGTKWNWNQHFTGPIDENGEWIIDLAKAYFNNERCR
jgi:hypothetical protein